MTDMGKNRKYDILVIGGGASGMMAAISAGRAGKKVAVIDHNKRLGKKILVTGNGKCNLTNLNQQEASYRGFSPEFIKPVFERFDCEKTLTFFNDLGILTYDKNSYVYPLSNQATTVAEGLCQCLKHLGIKTYTENQLLDLRKNDKGFEVLTSQDNFTCQKLIFAVGGLAAPKQGSDGSAYPIIKKLGHSFKAMVPSLCGLICQGKFFKELHGIRVNGRVTLYIDQRQVAEESGEIQLTNYGISGIPVFQINRFAAYGLLDGKVVEAKIDFLPELSEEELVKLFEKKISAYPDYSAEEIANGFLNQKLMGQLMKQAGISYKEAAGALTEKRLRILAKNMKGLRVRVTENCDFEKAQVMAGGIPQQEVTENLESKLIPGLYFAGEVLDVDGMCGGYNLQWAWSSGYVAGISAAEGIR